MKQSYGLGEIGKNVLSLIYTKIFFRNARLIRRPFYVRGRKNFLYGKGLTLGYGCRFEMFDDKKRGRIIIGSNCKFGDYVHISACERVEIGNNDLFASHILISDNQHGKYKYDGQSSPNQMPDERELEVSPVIIGNNVWIGESVTILCGVTIGNGVVIGAGSVVTKSIPESCIAVGNPARVIKRWNEDSCKWEQM